MPVRHLGQLVQKQPGAGPETDHGAEITRVRRSVAGVCNASGSSRVLGAPIIGCLKMVQNSPDPRFGCALDHDGVSLHAFDALLQGIEKSLFVMRSTREVSLS